MMVEKIINIVQNHSVFDMRLLYSLVIFLGIGVIGYIVKKIIFPRLIHKFEKYNLKNTIKVVTQIQKIFTVWVILIGVYLAVIIYPLSESQNVILNKIILIIFIISLGSFLMNVTEIIVKSYNKKKKNFFQETTLLDTIIKLAIFTTLSLIILQSLGVSIAPILTALGVGGLAVALALQDTLSNFFAGFHILASRQVSQGDYIRLNTGEEGYVLDITWKNTSIRSLKNNIHVIPNANLSSTIITNYNQPQKEMAVLVQVGVSYDSDLEMVETVTIEAAKRIMGKVPGGVVDFEPFIRYHTFNDFSIDFTVILRAKEFVDQYLIKHEFVKELHKAYKDADITIPFPIRTVIQEEATS